MLEIIEKSYPIEATAQDVAEDITPLWDWYKVETSETSIKFYVHETAYLEIVKEESHSPYLQSVSNGFVLVDTVGRNYISSRYLYVHIAKTNFGVVIQSSINPANTISAEKTAGMIIISNATNHYTGVITPVISVLHTVSNQTGTAYNKPYICSPEIIENQIVYTDGILYGLGANKMVLVPFFSDVSQCTLNGVYLCVRRMTTELYRGECMLSGRKAYMNGWIMIPCE